MNKKGITLQPFLFIMALFVMIMVVVFGTKSIMDIKGAADFTELSLFITNLKDEAQIFYHFDIGSSKLSRLGLPSNIEFVCFTNPGTTPTIPISDPFFKSILENNARNNVFILPLDSYDLTAFTIPYLMIEREENPLCIRTAGILEAELETTLTDDNNIAVTIRREV